MSNRRLGHRTWVFSGGYIPLDSTGKEPDYLSKDTITILNTTDQDATVKMTFFFEDQDPAGPFEIGVKPARIRRFHVNDLIDPHALPLGVPYGGVLESDVPVVVQITKQHTGQAALALMGVGVYPGGQ